jgi:hypothetical protein
VVRLVDDGDLDGVEGDMALTHEVLEPARAGDDDVDAAAQALDLRVLADASEDRLARQARDLGERDEGGVDLRGELARRGQDQGAGAAWATAVGRRHEPGDEGQQERVGLAGPGAAASEDVTTGQRVGQGRGLDGGGGGDPAVLEDGGEGRGHAEGGEGRVG